MPNDMPEIQDKYSSQVAQGLMLTSTEEAVQFFEVAANAEQVNLRFFDALVYSAVNASSVAAAQQQETNFSANASAIDSTATNDSLNISNDTTNNVDDIASLGIPLEYLPLSAEMISLEQLEADSSYTDAFNL